ncbi:hypothetical protein ACHAWF_017771 [Thalassiosira exigua]
MPLHLEDVRRLARNYGLREVQFNEESRVVAFKNDEDDTRFNVYYTTRTVGTYLLHPRQGKTQLFRRNRGAGRWEQAEKTALDYEISEVKGIIEDHDRRREEKRRQEEAERQRIEEEEKKEMRRKRGIFASWYLEETDDFEKIFTEYTCCVAMGSDGAHLCLYDGGGWAYSSGLCDNLHKLLHTRALSHPSPKYVAMGSMGRYFIRFANGKTQWVGPDDMSDLLHSTNKGVKSVAFGEDYEDYFVVFEDGWYQYSGCSADLQKLLNDRGCRSDLEKVTLGPNGEWCLWAKNGKYWWGGVDTNVSDEITSSQRNRTITDLLFGDDGYYFIRHT